MCSSHLGGASEGLASNMLLAKTPERLAKKLDSPSVRFVVDFGVWFSPWILWCILGGSLGPFPRQFYGRLENAGKPHAHTIPRFRGGGILGFFEGGGGGKCRFCFYGREDFSDHFLGKKQAGFSANKNPPQNPSFSGEISDQDSTQWKSPP